MRTDVAQPVRLADYRPADYLIDTVHLDVRLHDTATQVIARLRHAAQSGGTRPTLRWS